MLAALNYKNKKPSLNIQYKDKLTLMECHYTLKYTCIPKYYHFIVNIVRRNLEFAAKVN